MSSPTSELRQSLRSTILRAGAGAGKTTRLVQQVFDVAEKFLQKEQRAPRLLVTTFTKKATQELRERLVKNACEKSPQLLEFVSSPSLLHISTIHGLLVLFLRRYGHLAGIDAGFKILDEAAASQMQRKIFKEFLLKSSMFAPLLEEFSVDEIIRAVSEIDEIKSIHPEANPYSENELKRWLCDFQQRFIEEGIRVLSEIAAESENTKWTDFASRAVTTLQSLAQANLPLREVYERWCEATVGAPRFSKNAFSAELNKELKDWEGRFEKYAERSVYDPQLQVQAAETLRLFSQLSSEMGAVFRARKKAAGLFEMKDLELITLDILRREPGLGEAFARDWDYSLIDEYQDTSPLQVAILERLLTGVPQYVVGDPQQSIYLFRGARSEVFAEAEEKITADQKGDLEFLKKNYRSTPELLSFINEFACGLGPEFSAMEPQQEAYDPSKSVAVFAPVSEKDERFLPIAQFIRQEGGRFDDFAVLARTNFHLMEIAYFLESQGIPTHVHAASGFADQREVLDVLFVLRFLANPHDYENLIGLLRTPWFKVDDSTLTQWALQMRERDWLNLCGVAGDHPVIARLQQLLVDSVNVGIFESLRRVALSTGMIDFSSYHDATGRRESNIWKLLMNLRRAERSPNFNFNAFVRQVLDGMGGSDEGDSEAVAALEPNRVNLMTVHKAKGLKFKKVIVPNMQAAPRTQLSRAHEKLVVFDEVHKKWSVRLALGEDEKKEHLPPAREALEVFAEREKAETKRLLYVAITRAVEKCFFTWHGAPENGSWAEMVKFDLTTPGLRQKENYSYEIWQGPWESAVSRVEEQRVITVREPWQPPVMNAAPERLSVSTLLDLTEEKIGERNSREVKSYDQLERSLRLPYAGTKIHSLLERLRYRPDMDIKAYLQKWFHDPSPQLVEGFEYVMDLSLPPMRKLLQQGEVEWGFQTKTARGVLEGQVDLWGIADDTIWVIDYKSGSDFFKERAFRQLELYSYAILRSGLQFPVKLAVIYPLVKKVEIRDGRESSLIAKEFGL